jgi:precorrin-6A/cobalt-precorrin-6A reductase
MPSSPIPTTESHGSANSRPRVLLLGGTAEASGVAALVAADGTLDAVLSYAGRVERPRAQPVVVRVGGFGGVAGLADWLRAERIAAVLDATHPFAARMSANAVAACAAAGAPLAALERAPWVEQPGDRWTHVPDLQGAAALLAARPPATVFLAVGRLHLPLFAAAPQHRYVLRLIDPPEGPAPLPDAEILIARGPFDRAGDRALMEARSVDVVVAKNAGGTASRAKIDAARDLGLETIMVARPDIPPRATVGSPEAALAWLRHAALSADRGV